MRVKLVLDCETGDPDDILTLMMCCDHPRVDLKAVTITPGSKAQVGLVRHVLKLMGREDVPVGAYNLEHPKECVSGWHYTAFGQIAPSDEAEEGWHLLLNSADATTVLLTGAPLKNIGALLKWSATAAEDEPRWKFGRWVAQGGFAGEGVVPAEKQLEKFKGLRTCPTYNFNGDPKSALAALAVVADRFTVADLVSKNVCHGVLMTEELREKFVDRAHHSERKSLAAVAQYCPPGKALHDPLAMVCAIQGNVGLWQYVEMFREKGEWGARMVDDALHTRIIVEHNQELFEQVLLET